MYDTKPGRPHPELQAAMDEASAHPGHWVPFAEKRYRSIQSYYTMRYPEFDFSFVRGVLHVRKGEPA